MSRVCPVTKRRVETGCKVSHAHNRTKRVFAPNLQNVSFLSSALGFKVRLRVSTAAIKTIEKFGGIDSFLMNAGKKYLNPELNRLKNIIIKRSSIQTQQAA